MKSRRFEQTILLVLLAFIGGAWIAFSRQIPSSNADYDRPEAPMVGHLAPDFTLQTPTGESITLMDYVDREGENGRPVVLNFWASWCGPCRIETPHFQRAQLKYGNQIGLFGVNQGENARTVTDFGRSFGLTYPLLVDESSTVSNQYAVLNLPTTVFIDRDGVVQEVFLGILSQAVLEERINKLLTN